MENQSFSAGSVLALFHEKLHDLNNKDEISQFVYILLKEWKGWSRAEFHLRRDEPLENEYLIRFTEALAELHQCKPIQYITGHVQFNELDLAVTPGVLIPRPETEELVSLIINDNIQRRFESISILDIGAGSGCIGLSIKKQFPFSAVTLLDISDTSINLVKNNALKNNCEVEVIQSDILNKMTWTDFREYQIIVSNPPYVLISEKKQMKKNVLLYEPSEALFVPDEDPLMFYVSIAEFSLLHLTRPGLLYFEINEKFGAAIKKMLLEKGFDKADLMKDINGKDRFIRAEIKPVMLDTSYWNVEH